MSVEEYSTPMYLVMEGAKPVAIYIDKESAEKAIERLIPKKIIKIFHKVEVGMIKSKEAAEEMIKLIDAPLYSIEEIPYRGNKNHL